MADYTLKNIPDDLFERLRSAAEDDFRSLNQEILSRLKRSFDAEEAKLSALHARWIYEALTSGEATPLKAGELETAFKRGVARAKSKKQSKARVAA